jgi:hypothetical protein
MILIAILLPPLAHALGFLYVTVVFFRRFRSMELRALCAALQQMWDFSLMGDGNGISRQT